MAGIWAAGCGIRLIYQGPALESLSVRFRIPLAHLENEIQNQPYVVGSLGGIFVRQRALTAIRRP
jgi:hypothetical protein